MYKGINNNIEISKRKNYSSVDELNEYIDNHERQFGEIVLKDTLIKRHDKKLRALQNLKIAIEKDRISKEKGI